jgi:hypothetical protein
MGANSVKDRILETAAFVALLASPFVLFVMAALEVSA